MTGFFVHIGDAHMAPGPRNEDRWRAIDQIVAENLDRDGLLGWLIPGDLNHARMSIDDRNAWALRLRQMADVAPVFICYGNHDLSGDLDVFGKLSAAWPITVVTQPQVLTVTLPNGFAATIFCLPYPTEAGLVAQGVAPGDMVQAARLALEAIFLDAGERLDAARRRGDLTLAIGHVNVAGSIVSTGQPNIGAEIEIDEALIARLGGCYVGLNHIHKAQAIGGAHYPGSICRLDWGETDAKGYLRVAWAPVCEQCGVNPAACFGEYERSEGETTYACDACCGHGNEDGWCKPLSEGGITGVGRRWFVETCQLPVPAMYHVEGWLSRDGFTYDVVGAEKPASWAGCEVRVRAKFHQSEKGLLELAKAHVYAEFAEAARFELEPVAVPDTALRAPEVAAARTLAEKVTAWAAETRTVLPADVLALLPSLEHGDADVLLARERAAADALLGVASDPALESEVAVA